MPALCASRVSWRRTGRAYALISWSRPFPLGYTGTDTSVILPSVTVMLTWTSPQRVGATEPSYVLVPVDVPDVVELDPPGLGDEPSELPESSPPAAGDGVAAVAGVVGCRVVAPAAVAPAGLLVLVR